jgi:ubiquinone/menaquinone biosynthesis C-methylase UbiE
MKLSVHHHFGRLYDAGRKAWQDPEAVLQAVGLKSGMLFIDVGCGYGFFSLPAARMVGEEGEVIGIDVNLKWLRFMLESAGKAKIFNLSAVVGRAESAMIYSRRADVVFFGNVLHDFDDPVKALTNARRMLKEGGILANLDWRKEDSDVGPPMAIRFDESLASRMISRSGLTIHSVTEQGPHHYLIKAVL